MLLFSKSRTYKEQCMFNSRAKTGIGKPSPQTGKAPGTRLRKIAFDCDSESQSNGEYHGLK